MLFLWFANEKFLSISWSTACYPISDFAIMSEPAMLFRATVWLTAGNYCFWSEDGNLYESSGGSFSRCFLELLVRMSAVKFL